LLGHTVYRRKNTAA